MSNFPPSTSVAAPFSATLDPSLVPTVGRRVSARLLDGVVSASIYILVTALLLVGSGLGAVEALLVMGLSMLLVGVGVPLVASATVGQLVLGLRCVSVVDGAPAGPRSLGKYTLEGLASSLSCGLLLLLALLTLEQPLRRSWFDKLTGLVVVHKGAVRSSPHAAPEASWLSHPTGAAPEPAGAPASSWELPTGSVVSASDRTQIRSAAPVVSTGPATSAARLVLDSGEEIPLRSAHVIGRDPVAPEQRPDALLHPVRDDSRSFSKTHLLVTVGAQPGSVWVTDLNSTNGVRCTTPDGQASQLGPGVVTAVVPGTRLTIGSRGMRVLR